MCGRLRTGVYKMKKPAANRLSPLAHSDHPPPVSWINYIKLYLVKKYNKNYFMNLIKYIYDQTRVMVFNS